jgi:hypothetical protein
MEIHFIPAGRLLRLQAHVISANEVLFKVQRIMRAESGRIDQLYIWTRWPWKDTRRARSKR